MRSRCVARALQPPVQAPRCERVASHCTDAAAWGVVQLQGPACRMPMAECEARLTHAAEPEASLSASKISGFTSIRRKNTSHVRVLRAFIFTPPLFTPPLTRTYFSRITEGCAQGSTDLETSTRDVGTP